MFCWSLSQIRIRILIIVVTHVSIQSDEILKPYKQLCNPDWSWVLCSSALLQFFFFHGMIYGSSDPSVVMITVLNILLRWSCLQKDDYVSLNGLICLNRAVRILKARAGEGSLSALYHFYIVCLQVQQVSRQKWVWICTASWNTVTLHRHV